MSGSIATLSFMFFFWGSSKNKLSLVSVPSVRPYAENDLVKDFLLLSISFCYSNWSCFSSVFLILFSSILSFSTTFLIIFSASFFVSWVLVLWITSIYIFYCFYFIFRASILYSSFLLFNFLLIGLSPSGSISFD